MGVDASSNGWLKVSFAIFLLFKKNYGNNTRNKSIFTIIGFRKLYKEGEDRIWGELL